MATRKPAKKPDGKAAPKKRADWEAIERDYRTGKFSDQELADKYDNVVTRQAISKRGKKNGWKKDLTQAVRAATKAKLIEAQAVAKVAEQVAGRVAQGCDATLTTVLAAAEANKQVVLAHRHDIVKLRSITMRMAGELESVTIDPKKVAELHELLTAGVDLTEAQLGEARDALSDLMRLPNRALIVQRLSQSLGRLHQMERIAHGLDEPDDPASADVGAPTLTDAQRASRLAFLLRKAQAGAEDCGAE